LNIKSPSDWEKLNVKLINLEELLKYYEDDESLSQIESLDEIVLQCHSKITFAEISYDKLIKKHTDNTTILVKKNSRTSNYQEFVKTVLIIISIKYQSGINSQTLYYLCREMFHYIIWLNKDSTPKNPTSAKESLVRYINYLQHNINIYDKLRKIGLSTISARNKQNAAIDFSTLLFNNKVDTSFYTSGVKLISENSLQAESNQPLSDDELAKQFTFYTQVFRRLTDIIIEHQILPQKLKTVNETIFISPTTKHIFNPQKNKSSYINTFNYQTCATYSAEELMELYNISKLKAQRTLYKRNITHANANTPFSTNRRILIGYALKAYFMHFLIITGMNDTTAANLKFEGDYEIKKVSINFKTIKWRAGGKEVKFKLQTEFIPDFIKYLQLRKYLIDNYPNGKASLTNLLIGTVYKEINTFPLFGGASYKCRQSFIKAFGKAYGIGSSGELRVTKGIWIRKKHGHLASAWVLQHSLERNLRNYSGRDEETSLNEMTNFYTNLSRVLREKEIKINTEVGGCLEPYKPEAITKSPVKLDCSTNEGCLHCKNYRIHGDEQDIHKLLSLKYVILESKDNAANIQHFEKVYGSTIKIIDSLISDIKKQKNDNYQIINTISERVFKHGLLTNYWQRKLEIYIQLGVIK